MSEARKDKNPPAFEAFVVENSAKGDKGFWMKVGAAWPTKNGGLRLQLSALPAKDGELMLLPYERERKAA